MVLLVPYEICFGNLSLFMNFVMQENQDMLIKCISQDLGFSGRRPIAACLIYKCLLHWRSFEVERTSVFDRIIQTIGSAIEVWNCLCRHAQICLFNLVLKLVEFVVSFHEDSG